MPAAPKPASTELKSLSRAGIPAALQRAERYRLLNEPSQAESICLDILRADPDNRDAVIVLLLALTDQFGEDSHCVTMARDLVTKLTDEYQHIYYSALISERQARASLKRGSPGSRHLAHSYFTHAMELYEKAEQLRGPGNDEALLRWNSCARAIEGGRLEPEPLDDLPPMLE